MVISLDFIRRQGYMMAMFPLFDFGDRARLRERFYGASFTVLAKA